MKKLRVEDLEWKNVVPFVTSSQLKPASGHASAKEKGSVGG